MQIQKIDCGKCFFLAMCAYAPVQNHRCRKIQKLMRNGYCVWTLDEYDGSWNGNCGATWCLEGTPHENGMRYCPECGKRLVRTA